MKIQQMFVTSLLSLCLVASPVFAMARESQPDNSTSVASEESECRVGLLSKMWGAAAKRITKTPPVTHDDFEDLYQSTIVDHLPVALRAKIERALERRNPSLHLSEAEMQSIYATFDQVMNQVVTEIGKVHSLAIDLTALKKGAEANKFLIRDAFKGFNDLNGPAQKRLLLQSFADHFLRYVRGSGSEKGISLADLERLQRHGHFSFVVDLKRVFSQIVRHKGKSFAMVVMGIVALPVLGQVNGLWGNVRSSWDLVGEQTAAPINAQVYSALAAKMHDQSQKASAKKEIERIRGRSLSEEEFEKLHEQASRVIVSMEVFERSRNTPVYRIGSALYADYLTEMNGYIVTTLELQNRMRFLAEDMAVLKASGDQDAKVQQQLSVLEGQRKAIFAAYRTLPGQLSALMLARSFWLVGANAEAEAPTEIESLRRALEMLLDPSIFNADEQWAVAEKVATAKLLH